MSEKPPDMPLQIYWDKLQLDRALITWAQRRAFDQAEQACEAQRGRRPEGQPSEFECGRQAGIDNCLQAIRELKNQP